MASPSGVANGVSTPPTNAQATQPNPSPPTTTTAQLQSSGGATAADTNGSDLATANPALPSQPATSATDAGLSKRPRDARLIHMVLASQGVREYQERVPLQLMDFAYRYTAGVLSDALALSAEGYGESNAGSGAGSGRRGGGQSAAAAAAAAGGDQTVSTGALKLAIASRAQYQFQGALPKEFLLEVAAEKNKAPLPRPEREFGIRLPPERYCFTGVGWGIKDEWESEGEEDVEMDVRADGEAEDQSLHEGVEGEKVDQEEFEEVMGVGNGNGDQEMGEG